MPDLGWLLVGLGYLGAFMLIMFTLWWWFDERNWPGGGAA